MQELSEAIKKAVKQTFDTEFEPVITRPEEKFGDYATNVALQLGAKLQKNPRQIAVALAGKLHDHPSFAQVSIAGPGFINVKLTDETLAQAAFSATNLPKPNAGKEILVEFGDPNPFKEMHIGHLYSYIAGDSIATILEASGATVRRLSYHGDVGLHVAMAVWGMRKSGVVPDRMDSSLVHNTGLYYQKGTLAYEESQEAKTEIEAINQNIYKKDNDEINKLYDWAKEQSFSEFDKLLANLKIKTDKRYLESQAATTGEELVRRHISSVFKESQGAVVYESEKAGLHTRVFITSKGLPTYEAKDLGLANLKDHDYPHTYRSIIITAHEQSDYFKVMLAALEEINKELSDKTTHLYHGFVTLATGKMSSRKGEVYTASKLMLDVQTAAKKLHGSNPEIEYGAIKYGFLKHRLGSNVVYNPAESVSLEGSSGPYLQYAYARAHSILQKVGGKTSDVNNLETGERSLARKISEYPEAIQRATEELLPNYIAGYLYELAQSFNRFYEKNHVIGDPRQDIRASLVKAYADVLKNGLGMLNIEAPEKI